MTELTFRPAGLRADGALFADWWHTVDRWTIGAVALLFALGMVLALAASPPLAEKNDLWTYHYVLRHAVFAVLALGVVLGVSAVPAHLLRRGGAVAFLGFFAITLMLPAFGTDFGKGATRWYSLGFISLQPSEFLKPAFVLIAAWLMAGAAERNGPPGRLISGALAIAIATTLALQPDFGQAMLTLAVWAVMLFVSGAPLFLLIGLAGAVGLAGTAAYLNSSHFAGRINGYLAEEVDPNTQLAYAQSAIREGGLFGVGAAQGSVKWTLPDAHTDFIIAVAAEEFGLILTLLIIGIYLFIVVRALLRLLEERNMFIRLAGTGLAAAFALQAFINMSVAIRLLPAKGMTLPFISYGGSSMVAAALGVGALLALTRARPQDPGASLRDSI
ncbi:cell division protein FtsW [Limibaculum sp. M0105]|uniref:Probable peptidoglycan glycosyltransferase FtsW n=1 Tax=Thermohalobaculum xanthum TaxID=2753746 RepID=A0A8J7M7E3_9RHOB|nr:putative peptidoglycan glycosyltransferase FtsW [Thermohalobaculum xanthum]MBK0399666.1 cell division protein FtsW [Thermohalobaculum xanthum]